MTNHILIKVSKSLEDREIYSSIKIMAVVTVPIEPKMLKNPTNIDHKLLIKMPFLPPSAHLEYQPLTIFCTLLYPGNHFPTSFEPLHPDISLPIRQDSENIETDSF